MKPNYKTVVEYMLKDLYKIEEYDVDTNTITFEHGNDKRIQEFLNEYHSAKLNEYVQVIDWETINGRRIFHVVYNPWKDVIESQKELERCFNFRRV